MLGKYFKVHNGSGHVYKIRGVTDDELSIYNIGESRWANRSFSKSEFLRRLTEDFVWCDEKGKNLPKTEYEGNILKHNFIKIDDKDRSI